MARYDYDVVIIGAGAGGLMSGALLSKEGMKVLVLEQSKRVGGCCSSDDVNGFKPDIGATFVIGIDLYYKFFELFDLRLEDYLDFKLIDPVYDVFFQDGTRVLLPRDIDEMAEVINSLSPGDVKGYYRYCNDLQKIFDAYLAMFRDPMPELRRVTSPGNLLRAVAKKEVLAALPVNLRFAASNLEKAVNGYFKDDRVRLLFSFENLYAALPARRAPAILSMVNFMGRTGYYYPMGGMIAIPKALQRILEDFNGEIRLNSPVEKIIVEGRKAKGVRLATGEELTARAVISNAHSRSTYLELVGPENLPYVVKRAVRNQSCSMPAPTFHLGLKKKMDSTRSHLSVVMPSKEMTDKLWDDFYVKGLMYRADDGGFLVSCASFDDPGLAPEGKQVLSVIYVAPYRLKYNEWDDIAEEYAWECVSALEKRAFPGLSSNIEWLDSVSPVEFERRLMLPEGAFTGIEMTPSNMGPFRPGNRSRAIKNLYLSGHCTNPGAGVPGALMSGTNTASALLNDWPSLG